MKALVVLALALAACDSGWPPSQDEQVGAAWCALVYRCNPNLDPGEVDTCTDNYLSAVRGGHLEPLDIDQGLVDACVRELNTRTCEARGLEHCEGVLR